MMTESEFSSLSAVFLPRLLRSAKRRWGSEGEDFIQEAFLRAYEDRSKFNHGCYFSTWIFGYALNIAGNSSRGNLAIDRDCDIFKIADYVTPETQFLVSEIYTLIDMLHPKQREAVLSRINGELHDRKNLWWARQELAKSLGVDCEE